MTNFPFFFEVFSKSSKMSLNYETITEADLRWDIKLSIKLQREALEKYAPQLWLCLHEVKATQLINTLTGSGCELER